ncbi:MAG: hypothetical protein JWS10_2379 [Cypionkella sp.]|uniref:sugar transferase n=1 Tax=Cypionkella sp. TaxID=2811411 RepID=UPI002613E9AB|nr:sugar transferase [Cypionkella sp.]MDB5659764.1 hypothetical protein [Cypionkella sp.]
MSRLSAFPSFYVSRLIDVVLASMGLVVLSPLFLLIMIAIVVDTGFPIFFAQTRIAQGGRTFQMYKFRKFHPISPGGSPLTMKHDSRMTRLGGVLAGTKLDELPQLYNIIRGDMAIVGPRPESMAFAGAFTARELPLLQYRPGIFGPSQVAFRNECCLYPAGKDPVQFYRDTLFPAKAALDLAYYSRRTVWGDFLWIGRGILAVLGKVPKLDLPPNVAEPSDGARKMEIVIAGE